MKIKKIIYIISVLALILASCNEVHEFREEDEEEVTPTLISLQITIKFTTIFNIDSFTTIEGKESENPESYDCRYIIEIYNNSADDNSLYTTQIVTRDASDTKDLSTSIKLQAKKYRIAVWKDYVKKGTKSDYFYLTSNTLTSVHLPDAQNYIAGTDYKVALSNTQEIDLTKYIGQAEVNIELELPLTSHMAKITLLANDIEKYAKETKEDSKNYDEIAKELKTDFSYNGYFPSGFNVITGKLNDATSGYGFIFQPYYPYSNKEITNMTILASDYVFVNGDSSSVTATFIIKNRNGEIVNTIANIVIPIHKGKETIIIDKYLTDSYAPGIGIDPKFDGEWDIIIN